MKCKLYLDNEDYDIYGEENIYYDNDENMDENKIEDYDLRK